MILESKDYRILDIVFQLVFGYADTWMWFQEGAPMTNIHVIYTDLAHVKHLIWKIPKSVAHGRRWLNSAFCFVSTL